MTKTLFSSCLLSASLLASTGFAASPYNANNNPNNADYTGWSWSGHVDHVTFDKEAAAIQGIEDSATAIGGAAEYYSSRTENTLSLGVNFLF